MEDRLGRPVRDLRVSVTDRCNLRCPYCMPREVFGPDFAFVDRDDLLRFDEITRVVRAAARLGVTKVRLTGGEPLLRRRLVDLVRQLAALDGIDDLALTTNGVLLADHAHDLAAAGLHRVTVSLDALDPATYAATSDSRQPVARVLDGIAAATRAGLGPVKLNTVVRRGVNDGEIEALAAFAREHGHVVRFIEFMDVGTTNGWRRDDVVPAHEIVGRVAAVFPAEPVPPAVAGEVATTYRYLDGSGTFGIVASVTSPFCGDCVRLRLSPVGELFTCLFSAIGHDLRPVLGAGDDAAVEAALARIWRARTDRYSELRTAEAPPAARVEMSYIGG